MGCVLGIVLTDKVDFIVCLGPFVPTCRCFAVYCGKCLGEVNSRSIQISKGVTCNCYDGIEALVANPTDWMKC
jgi:hypothetical protein